VRTSSGVWELHVRLIFVRIGDALLADLGVKPRMEQLGYGTSPRTATLGLQAAHPTLT
jgi:hypothetical protein